MFDCEGCRNPDPHLGFPYYTEDERRSFHCGWIEPVEWTDLRSLPISPENEKRVLFDEAGERLPADEIVCPGWLVRQPEVLEGAHAYSVREKGELATYYPNLEHAILEAADVMGWAVSEYEQEQLRKQSG